MPIYPQSPDQKNHGFTIVEMLVVMSIMALAVLLLIGRPQFGGSADFAKNKAALHSELAILRQAAMSEGHIRALDASSRSLRFEPAVGIEAERLLFWPDGSSNGGKLSDAKGQILAQVDWRSGDIYDPE